MKLLIGDGILDVCVDSLAEYRLSHLPVFTPFLLG